MDELPHPIAHLRRPTQLVAPLHQRTLNSEAPKEGETCAAFLERAVDFSSSHGVTTERVMTDSDWSYKNTTRLDDLNAANPNRKRPCRPQT